ncbi:hypothetical protein GUJ93_ZPchr0003g17083 [Zizania palustris]|uniref:Photosystem II D1 processing protein PSB27-H2, chloroplastic n=1 Tax=Zizania palustris TaxID=103762 RepID=A0A8J5S8C6_ZIZPA|nr:hypothetical protein GUJ93_ZPchr0003g17083 [Zizania palustris]
MRAMPSPPATVSLMTSRCCCCSSAPPPRQAICGARLVAVTRRAHAASLLAAVVGFAAGRARAEEKAEGGGEEGVLSAIKSIFDPNEKTEAGKVLPKAYLKAAREVVRTLRESLEEDDGGDMAKFRRGADAAKASIREFLGGWRGQQVVAAEVRATQGPNTLSAVPVISSLFLFFFNFPLASQIFYEWRAHRATNLKPCKSEKT